jgi:prepilin-type N-terminal cleavage/methylation domain-containing protein
MKKAFTLVETLIVIAVFGTGILAVLYGIAQTLGQQDKAKTQITSSFLAREGIELMYNLRDSNYRKALPWNCLFQPIDVGAVVSADDVCSSSSRFQS